MADLPGVGANLTDHPAVSLDFGYPRQVRPAPLFQVIATTHSTDAAGDGPPDLQYIVGGPFADGDRGTFFIGVALLKPASRGTVRLRSADPSAAPRIDLGYFREPRDLDRLANGLIRIREPAGTGPIAELARGEELAPGPGIVAGDRHRLRQWIRRNARTCHHPAGTCAMGCGLTVADASIMPDIPSANTHIPTIMIAERVASLLVTHGTSVTRARSHGPVGPDSTHRGFPGPGR